MVVTKIYNEPPVCKKEILRYAGCKGTADETIQLLMEECLKEVLPKLCYKVCYIELPLERTEEICDFGCMKLASKDLAKNLQGCENVVLFAATIGVEIDRLITRYSHLSPAKAMMLQAIGAERIESLCDVFCESIKQEYQGKDAESYLHFRPRFSPGYGDLSLETQRDIFQVLNCSKNIGLSLNDSLLMSPTKSVTAFVGISEVTKGDLQNKYEDNVTLKDNGHNCEQCKKMDCAYRI